MFTPTADVTNWKDLQNKVKDFFIELEYSAKTEYPVELSVTFRPLLETSSRPNLGETHYSLQSKSVDSNTFLGR